MREIKFRAWYKPGERMIDLKFRVWDTKEKEYAVDGMIYFFDIIAGRNRRYILEQYTGLKDKNGKEIWVGDVVSEHNGDIIGEIIQKPSGEYCIAWVGVYGGSSVLYDELSMCEVIGNIHENPELLGGRI